MNKSVIKQFGMFLGTLILAVASISGTAKAQTGSVGCGAGSGSTDTSCSGSITTASGVTGTNSSGIGVTLTSHTPIPPSVLAQLPPPAVAPLLEELTVNGEPWNFSFQANDATGNGYFILDDSDGSNGGIDFGISGTISGFTAASNGTGFTYTFNLAPNSVGLGADGVGLFAGFSVSGYSGHVTIVDPPSSITSFSGSFGIPLTPGPNPNGVTPEPGTLLLLGSGLTGIGFLRRKFWA